MTSIHNICGEDWRVHFSWNAGADAASAICARLQFLKELTTAQSANANRVTEALTRAARIALFAHQAIIGVNLLKCHILVCYIYREKDWSVINLLCWNSKF